MLEVLRLVTTSILVLSYGLVAVYLAICAFGWARRRRCAKRAARRRAWQAPEAPPVTKPKCRYGECATLYLNSELSSKQQQWFDRHCVTCRSCWERFVQEKRVRAPDERCLWERDVRAYMNHRLSDLAREQFKGHLTICEYCTGEVENEEERLESWLEEWEARLKLEYRPRSHGESAS